MARITRERVTEAGISERVELICGDGACMPFPSESFDAVFTSFTLELFDTPEIPQVLSECLRVLRPDGRISVVSLTMEGGYSKKREIYEWAHHRFPTIIDCRPIFVRKSILDAGFTIKKTVMISVGGLPVEIVMARKPL
jgi:demethylmenaquinone methyltransferase/2-methoxy-6-polyprenyl-1,4-benzoquinol methylase